jgi:NADP-dependent 3-hydroxy acid dehydrogenase YdfG
VAVVIGATAGMGWESALDLARDHDVIAVGRSREALDELGRRPYIRAVACDVFDPAQREQLARDLPRVDVLVHAASGTTSGPDVDAAAWQQMLEVFLIGPAELTRLLLPQLREARGTVVFIGSGAGTRPVPGMALYAAAKHGLRGYADTLRIDEAGSGIRVATVAPGPTDTPGARRAHEAAGAEFEAERFIQPVSVARAVRFVVDAPADAHITDVAVRPRTEFSR